MHDCTTLPVTPGAVIGWRADGRPIRLIGGGSEPLPPAEAPAAPEPPAAEPVPAAPATAGTPADDGGQAPQGSPGGQESIDQLAQSWQKHIRELRSQAGEYRTKAKQATDALAAREAEYQARMDGIAKALGVLPEETTPEQIAAERDAARARADESAGQARAAAVELAVFRAASAMAVNPNALLDSRTFAATLAGLDPAADDFAQQVMDRITAAAEQNPGWKLTPAAAPGAPPAVPPPLPGPAIPASGPPGSFTAAPAGPRQLSVEETHGMTPAQVQDVINQGLLVDAGFGPKRGSRR